MLNATQQLFELQQLEIFSVRMIDLDTICQLNYHIYAELCCYLSNIEKDGLKCC